MVFYLFLAAAGAIVTDGESFCGATSGMEISWSQNAMPVFWISNISTGCAAGVSQMKKIELLRCSSSALGTAWEEGRLSWETGRCLCKKGLEQGRGALKYTKLFCLGIGRGVACMKFGLLR